MGAGPGALGVGVCAVQPASKNPQSNRGGASRRRTRTPWWYHARVRAAHCLGLSLVLSCAARAPEPFAHTVAEVAPPTRVVASSEPARAVPTWLAEALQWPAVTSEPLRSAHFAKTQLAEIRVNPEARATYIALTVDTELPIGTRIVESHRDAVTGKPGPILAVVRTPQGWEFSLLDSTGRALGDQAPSYCAGCHEGARAVPIFGLVDHPQVGN